MAYVVDAVNAVHLKFVTHTYLISAQFGFNKVALE